MKLLRRLLDRLHPTFDKGGKLEKLYPLYEAGDTFLYTPGEVTRGASHVRDAMDMKRMMITVVFALTPCILMGMWNTGYQANLVIAAGNGTPIEGWRDAVISGSVGYDSNSFLSNFVHGALWFLPLYLITNIVGGLWEVLFACVRRHEINEGFLVTGMLFPLTLPPSLPLWQAALGISFGVVIGKEVFGGTGKNFLNPALTARAFLYFAYPAQITGATVWTAVDGYTKATPLGEIAAVKKEDIPAMVEQPMSETLGDVTWMQTFLGDMQGSIGETSTLCCLLGAAILIATGIGSWRIMLSMALGTFAFAAMLWGIGSETNPVFALPPWWHLTTGGVAFGLVFMATDPVSASMTELGKWFYGVLIGVMTVLVRVINPAFPEGVMLAILFGNVFAPLIDYFVVQANIKRRLARDAA